MQSAWTVDTQLEPRVELSEGNSHRFGVSGRRGVLSAPHREGCSNQPRGRLATIAQIPATVVTIPATIVTTPAVQLFEHMFDTTPTIGQRQALVEADSPMAVPRPEHHR